MVNKANQARAEWDFTADDDACERMPLALEIAPDDTYDEEPVDLVDMFRG